MTLQPDMFEETYINKAVICHQSTEWVRKRKSKYVRSIANYLIK